MSGLLIGEARIAGGDEGWTASYPYLSSTVLTIDSGVVVSDRLLDDAVAYTVERDGGLVFSGDSGTIAGGGGNAGAFGKQIGTASIRSAAGSTGVDPMWRWRAISGSAIGLPVCRKRRP